MNKPSFAELSEAIINNIEESIFLFDIKGRLIFINKAAEEFIGYTSKQVYNRHYSELFNHSNDIIILIQKTLQEGRPFNCKDISLNNDENIKIDIYLYPFYSTSLLEGAIVCIRLNNILTERVNDFQFDSLLFLLASIAHEIKNPLSGIKGAAQLLKDEIKDEAKQYIDIIIKETDRLNHILYDYLSISRKPVFSEVNIHEILEHSLKIMEPLIKEKKIEIYKSYDPSLPNLMGDASKLLQVFINLIKNSIESMQSSRGNRKISISTKPASEYVILYENDYIKDSKLRPKKQRWIIINFEDTGKGVMPSEFTKIFLPFYTKKKRGTGLGLALSQKIIRDHGGIIMVKNKKTNMGAIFSIYLPF